MQTYMYRIALRKKRRGKENGDGDERSEDEQIVHIDKYC
jgi:hypothetical protein